MCCTEDKLLVELVLKHSIGLSRTYLSTSAPSAKQHSTFMLMRTYLVATSSVIAQAEQTKPTSSSSVCRCDVAFECLPQGKDESRLNAATIQTGCC
jgi:hypothetical protein